MANSADMQRVHAATEAAESQLRLHTTVRLRWFAVAGQLAAIGFVHLGLGYPMPVGLCLLLIAASAWLNIILRVTLAPRQRLSAGLATVLQVYDVIQLGLLLSLTGGATNPFVFLIVAPVTVSAATLTARNTLLVGAVAALMAGAIAGVHLPLPWPAEGPVELPMLYKLGLLASVYATMTFLGFYVWRLATEARQMSQALAATELVLAREQRLHALDGLAAAAAHELGTPLSTIVLAAKELETELASAAPSLASCLADARLLRAESARCRAILEKLAHAPEAADPVHGTLSLSQLLTEAAGVAVSEVVVVVDIGPEPDTAAEPAGAEPVGQRRPGVIHGLRNLIENATSFARTKVTITARWSRSRVSIAILDDGPGFAPEILESLGDPFVGSRRFGSGGDGRAASAQGMGLGYFIAKSLLERSGASLTAANRSGVPGAIVQITWARAAFETPDAGEVTAAEPWRGALRQRRA